MNDLTPEQERQQYEAHLEQAKAKVDERQAALDSAVRHRDELLFAYDDKMTRKRAAAATGLTRHAVAKAIQTTRQRLEEWHS